MIEHNPLTHYSVTIRFIDHPGHFEPEVLAKSPDSAARIAFWRLKPKFRDTTVALIISAPIAQPDYFPAYQGQPLAFVRNERQRTLLSPIPSASSESWLLQPANLNDAADDRSPQPLGACGDWRANRLTEAELNYRTLALWDGDKTDHVIEALARTSAANDLVETTHDSVGRL